MSSSIRIATPPHTTPEQTLANLLAAAPSAVALIQDGWENVLSVGIKTSSSVLLPIWSSELDGRFKVATHGKAGEEDVEMAEDGGMRKEDGKREKEKRKKEKTAEVEERAGVTVKKEKTAEVEERAGVTVKKAKAVKMIPTSEPKKAEKIAKKSGKKSSSLGMGGAGKRAKEAVLGRKT